jgi:hypothetical protein
MATGNPYSRQPQFRDFTARLPPGSPGADSGMVTRPYADPGYGMPNAFVGNLNQAPGQEVGGWLRANALQITDPNADSDNPLARASAWADPVDTGAALGTSVDRLGQWLSEQRAKSAKMGLWNEATGLPTAAGVVNAAQQYGNAMMMGTTAPGVRGIEVSGGPLRGQSNIVRFGEDADAIHATLPPVSDGMSRLWRGNRPDEAGTAQQFTNSLEGIALPFREMYGGPVSYVDVPTAHLPQYLQTAGAAPGAEFYLPSDIAGQAKAVHVTPRSEPGARNYPRQ